jgi:tetratricopeptide (TPR) repeat protein
LDRKKVSPTLKDMHRFILAALLFSFLVPAKAQEYDRAVFNKLIGEGVDSFFAGNNDFAHQKFITAYQIDSGSFYSLFYLSWSKLERKEYAESFRLVSKAIYLADPGRNEEFCYYVRGLINYELGRYPQSASDFTKVNAITPYDVKYLLLLARSLAASKEFQKIIPVADQAIDLDSSRSTGYFYRGLAYSALGQTKAAIADFKTNLSLEPKEMQSLYHLGDLNLRLKSYKQAAGYYDEYLAQRKDSIFIDTALLQAGVAHHLAGNNAVATDRLNTLLKKRPQSPLAYVYLGSIAAEKNDTVKTREYYIKALSFKPERSVALHCMAKLELHAGNKAKSNELFKKASVSAERERDAVELYELAKTHLMLGDTATCHQLIEKSLSIDRSLVLPRLLRVTLQMHKPEYEEEVFNDLDRLIARRDVGKEERAWFLAYKAVAASALKRYSDAIQYLDEAITWHGFAEYYALRAYLKAIRYRNTRAVNSIMRNEIEGDINKALETNHRKNETMELKAMILVIFDRYKEACELVASIAGSEMNQLCKDGEKQPAKWDVRYKLSAYEEMASDF